MFGWLSDEMAFALESLSGFGVPYQVLGQYLNRDCSFQSRVPGLVHLAHAARTQGSNDLVRPKPGTRRKRHPSPKR